MAAVVFLSPSLSLVLPLQGVVEFSFCLLFAKLVSYTFLYWLPLYIVNVGELLEGSQFVIEGGFSSPTQVVASVSVLP